MAAPGGRAQSADPNLSAFFGKCGRLGRWPGRRRRKSCSPPSRKRDGRACRRDRRALPGWKDASSTPSSCRKEAVGACTTRRGVRAEGFSNATASQPCEKERRSSRSTKAPFQVEGSRFAPPAASEQAFRGLREKQGTCTPESIFRSRRNRQRLQALTSGDEMILQVCNYMVFEVPPQRPRLRR